MIRRDFHGLKLDQALSEVHRFVTQIRLQKKTEELQLIVGHGIIRDKVLELLTEYNLDPSIQLGNSGVIICTLE